MSDTDVVETAVYVERPEEFEVALLTYENLKALAKQFGIYRYNVSYRDGEPDSVVLYLDRQSQIETYFGWYLVRSTLNTKQETAREHAYALVRTVDKETLNAQYKPRQSD